MQDWGTNGIASIWRIRPRLNSSVCAAMDVIRAASSKLRGIRLVANELPYFFIAATTEISTKSSGRAIRASTQARAGA
jgi:hypothetical protein